MPRLCPISWESRAPKVHFGLRVFLRPGRAARLLASDHIDVKGSDGSDLEAPLVRTDIRAAAGDRPRGGGVRGRAWHGPLCRRAWPLSGIVIHPRAAPR